MESLNLINFIYTKVYHKLNITWETPQVELFFRSWNIQILTDSVKIFYNMLCL